MRTARPSVAWAGAVPSAAPPMHPTPPTPARRADDDMPAQPDRRRLLAGAGVLAGWLPLHRVAAATGAVPAGFPASVPLYRQAFRNWAQDIVVDAVWTCSPRTPDEVVLVVNWAWRAGYKVRARGHMHNWSPLTVATGQPVERVLLLDMTASLDAVQVHAGTSPPTVTAQCGVDMATLLARLEQQGLGLTATPAPGDLTLGGVLAIDGHGTAVPAIGETRQPGQTYGSVSNSVLALTAVVFDPAQQRYVLRRFVRNDPAIAPLLVHLGRALVVDATLQVGRNQRLRCRSHVDIAAGELFAPQGSGGRTFASFLDTAGRVEAIWFPFTRKPWLKVWSLAPQLPLLSRPVLGPYNYPFSDTLPLPITELIRQIVVDGQGWLTPSFGATQLAISTAGLASTLSADLWGWSKNLLLYVRPTTLRVTANGYAVLTRRADVQRVIHEFTSDHEARVARWAGRGLYPMNGPVEIRVTGLDRPDEVAMPGAVAPALSALRPRPDRPAWDTAVWFDLLTLPGTPGAAAFYRESEQWMLSNYGGDHAALRVEWSKGWGYSDAAAWDDPVALGSTVPQSLRTGQPADAGWDAAVAALNRLDPYRLFTSPLHDRLMP